MKFTCEPLADSSRDFLVRIRHPDFESYIGFVVSGGAGTYETMDAAIDHALSTITDPSTNEIVARDVKIDALTKLMIVARLEGMGAVSLEKQ